MPTSFPVELPGGPDASFCEVMDAAPVMIWVSGTDKQCFWFNRPWLNFTGRDIQQEVGNGWTEGVHPDDFDRCLKTYVDHFDARKEFRMEYRLRRYDRTYRWIDDTGIPRYAQDGSFLGYIGSCTDVHQHKETEAELRESEENYRTLFESIDEGFCTIEVLFDQNEKPVDYRFLQISPSFERQTGIENAAGRRMREIAPRHEEHWFEIYGRIALTGEPMRFENEAKQLGRWYDVYAFRIGDFARRRVGILFNDITERKRAEAEARDSERRYREVQTELAHASRVATTGQLTASIAHEIRQPIAATVGNAQAGLNWLNAKPPNLEEVRHTLRSIVSAGKQASDVMDRIRALIKKAPPRKEDLAINDAVLEVIALTRAEILKNGVSKRTQLAEGLPRVHGDRVQLQQVMLNFIVNAVEAMREVAKEERELLISTRHEPDGVCVEVRDSGPGFAPTALEHVFDAFYTTKAGGLGLGLSICRSIVEAHDGRLWASPNTPHGAIFSFIVPARPAVAS
jgi:PAS domain S-box-containing protein